MRARTRILLGTAAVLLATSPFGEAQEKAQSMSKKSTDSCVVLTTSVISSRGGELVAGLGSLLAGTRVSFPPTAVPDATTATLGYCVSDITLRSGMTDGTLLTLTVNPLQRFVAPVSIEVVTHTAKLHEIVVPYLVDAAGKLHVAQIKSFDKLHGRLVFTTFGPGRFLWVYP